jgi:O-antigen ligase
LGRANFLGAYLAMLAPLTLALLITAAQRRERVLWAFALGGGLLIVGLTLSRGAWLAAAVALFSFALLWRWPRLASAWRWAGTAFVCLLCIGGPLAVLTLGQRAQGSIGARLAIWQASTRLIAERPLLG